MTKLIKCTRCRNKIGEYCVLENIEFLHVGGVLAREFHDDTHPSFWIDRQHQVCGCFTCNFAKPMDVVNFIGRLYGLSNLEAIHYLVRSL